MGKPITEAELVAIEGKVASACTTPNGQWLLAVDDLPRVLAEVRRLRGNISGALGLMDALVEDVDDGIAWRQRPKGGQQVGHCSSPFVTTPPSGTAYIKRTMRWVRERLEAK